MSVETWFGEKHKGNPLMHKYKDTGNWRHCLKKSRPGNVLAMIDLDERLARWLQTRLDLCQNGEYQGEKAQDIQKQLDKCRENEGFRGKARETARERLLRITSNPKTPAARFANTKLFSSSLAGSSRANSKLPQYNMRSSQGKMAQPLGETSVNRNLTQRLQAACTPSGIGSSQKSINTQKRKRDPENPFEIQRKRRSTRLSQNSQGI